MNLDRIVNILGNTQQYSSKMKKSTINETSFMENLKNAEEANTEKIDIYKKYLSNKYGVNLIIKSIDKKQKSFDSIGKSMNGNDVIIAPNILEQMANDSEKAAYYEGKIQDFFSAIPELSASFAAKGLVYKPCGVIIHEDGSVTYVGGCSDSPERVAQVNKINKAKREKKVAQIKANLEKNEEITKEQKELAKIQYYKQTMLSTINNNIFNNATNYYIYRK